MVPDGQPKDCTFVYLTCDHPDKSRNRLTPYSFKISLVPFAISHFTSWRLSFQMSSCIRYRLVKDSQSTLTLNIKGTAYVTCTAQCQVLISELNPKRRNHESNISIEQIQRCLSSTIRRGPSFRVSYGTRRN